MVNDKPVFVSKKKGEYILKPDQSFVGKTVSVSVSVKNKDGNNY